MKEEEKLVYDLLCTSGELTAQEVLLKLDVKSEIDKKKYLEALDQLHAHGNAYMASVNENDGTKLQQLSDIKVKWIADIRREKLSSNPAYYFFS